MENEPKENQVQRILKMYDKLMHGECLSMQKLVSTCHVSEKTIQRDIGALRSHLDNKILEGEKNKIKKKEDDKDDKDEEEAEDKNIVYDKENKQYTWKNRGDVLLTDAEIVLVSKILLESRGLTEDGIEILLDKLGSQCSEAQCKLIKALTNNERKNYVQVSNAKDLGDMILDISMAKQRQYLINIWYKKVGADRAEKLRIIPAGIMFAEYYFYLLADDGGKEIVTPITYRLDRIEKYEILTEKFRIEREDLYRFKEGDFRKRIQFMSTGELLSVKFQFWGKSLEAVKDRLPDMQECGNNEKGVIWKVDVYGKGIKMWFLSQAEFLEVLEPKEFRQEMKECIQNMLKNYTD